MLQRYWEAEDSPGRPGERYFKQEFIIGRDPVLKFGPLSSSLSDLFRRGHYLSVWVKPGDVAGDRKVSLRLNAEGKTYRVAKPRASAVLSSVDLAVFVKSDKDIYSTGIAFQPRPDDPLTPWERLFKKYPGKKPNRSTTVMVGNASLQEYVSQSLRAS